MPQPRKPTRDTWGSTIAMPGGGWRLRYPGPDGRRRSGGVFRTKAAAEEARAKLHTAVAGGVWRPSAPGDSPTLAVYADAWLTRSALDALLSPRTVALYLPGRSMRRALGGHARTLGRRSGTQSASGLVPPPVSHRCRGARAPSRRWGDGWPFPVVGLRIRRTRSHRSAGDGCTDQTPQHPYGNVDDDHVAHRISAAWRHGREGGKEGRKEGRTRVHVGVSPIAAQDTSLASHYRAAHSSCDGQLTPCDPQA